jgi:hypothetical protein
MNARHRESEDGFASTDNPRETGHELLPKTGSLNPAELRCIANNLFGNRIEWESEDSGFMECPGYHIHTSPNQPRDCRIKIDQGKPPTISCFHNSCRAEIAKANKNLRSTIGKAKWTGKPFKTRTQTVPSEQKDELSVCKVTPVPLPTETILHSAAVFLKSLFNPDDLVAIYDCRRADQKTAPDGRTKYSPGSGTTRRVSDLISELDAVGGIGNLYSNGLTLFIRANPMHPNGKSDRDVAAYRYVLVDIDKDENGNAYPLEVQYGALLASKLPLASITYSGDISLAALVHVNAENELEYKSRKDQVYERMKQFIKIDDSCGNPSRWTRFPGGTRHLGHRDNGDLHREQRLIALNQGTSDWTEYLEALEQEMAALQITNPSRKCSNLQTPEAAMFCFSWKSRNGVRC